MANFDGFCSPDIKMWHPTTTSTGDTDGKGEDFGDFNAWRSQTAGPKSFKILWPLN